MTVFNLGSINLDYFYKVPHLPKPGETLGALSFSQGLGGKGANQSVALARGGADVYHIGQIHKDDEAHIALMAQAGVDLTHIARGDVPTGHAIVVIDDASGENQILLMAGANHALTDSQMTKALEGAKAGDWALTQNETNLGEAFLKTAKSKGLQICYSAAPFVKDQLLALIDYVDLLVVNEGEADEIAAALGKAPEAWGLPHLVVTKGAQGAYYWGKEGALFQPSEQVKAVDTTGAGDTYLGFLLAQLSHGASISQAMAIASKAASIQVTRFGTADAIPALAEL